MPSTTTTHVWPTLRAKDARSLIRFLVDAFGFEESVVYEEGGTVHHAELTWPAGGGLMLGSARPEPDPWALEPGSAGVYVVTEDPDALFARATAAGAEVLQPVHDTDYGSRELSVRDPEGNRWSFGTYAGPERHRGSEEPVTDGIASTEREPLVLLPSEGRPYPMGHLSAVFKADGAETAGRYSISEWWLDGHTRGPGPHAHPEDDVFFVLDGTMSFLVRDQWIDAPAGSFVLVPGGATHDFENRGDLRAGMLNISAPGNFEERMPGIAEWFTERPPADAVC